MSPTNRKRSGVVGDGVKLLGAALAFWALYFGAVCVGINAGWIHAALATAWVFGIAIAIFRHLWHRTWFWFVVGTVLPVHALIWWVLPNQTPFDAGMSIVSFNFELWGLVALITQLETFRQNRVRRHASRQGI